MSSSKLYMYICQIELPKFNSDVIPEEPLEDYLKLAASGDLCTNSHIDDYEIGGVAWSAGALSVTPYIYRPDTSSEYINLTIVDTPSQKLVCQLYGIVKQGRVKMQTKSESDLFVKYQLYQGVTDPAASDSLRDNVQGQDSFLVGVTVTLIGDISVTGTPVALMHRIYLAHDEYPRTFLAVYPNTSKAIPQIITMPTEDNKPDSESQAVGAYLKRHSMLGEGDGESHVHISLPETATIGGFQSNSVQLNGQSAVYFGLDDYKSLAYSQYIPNAPRRLQMETEETMLEKMGVDMNHVIIQCIHLFRVQSRLVILVLSV